MEWECDRMGMWQNVCLTTLIKHWPKVTQMYYSGTSDKGLFEKGTTSLQRTLSISQMVYFCMELIHIFNFWKQNSLPTRDKMAGPKVSITQRFHCTTMVVLNITSQLELIINWVWQLQILHVHKYMELTCPITTMKKKHLSNQDTSKTRTPL